MLAGQGQAHIAVTPTHALAGVKVVDAALAASDLHPRAMAVGRVARDDIDHRHQCIGAIADGVRAAENFDALDILHGHWNVAPVHRGQAGAVHRATVDQHLHASRFAGTGAVIVHRRLVAADVADHHPRHQPQHFTDVPGATGVDQCAVDHGHAPRHGSRRLFQARGRQHLRQRLTVEEQIVSQQWRAEDQRQYQRRAG
ncbi:hypothetical protein D3C87_1381930 [compost metagenome]